MLGNYKKKGVKCKKFYFFVFRIFLSIRIVAFLSFLCAEEVRRGIMVIVNYV